MSDMMGRDDFGNACPLSWEVGYKKIGGRPKFLHGKYCASCFRPMGNYSFHLTCLPCAYRMGCAYRDPDGKISIGVADNDGRWGVDTRFLSDFAKGEFRRAYGRDPLGISHDYPGKATYPFEEVKNA